MCNVMKGVSYPPNINQGDNIFVSVSLFVHAAMTTAIAILLNSICLRMVREDKLTFPPKLLKRIFSGKMVKMLAMSNYQVLYKALHNNNTPTLDNSR